ncbi:MAG: DoxX family membrane protein, partial [Flavobacteriales bacterium]|nr:DoxX family membrane protein [Flavobacteriales bacterium]
MTIETLKPIDKLGLPGHVGLLMMRLYVGLSMMSAGLDKIPLPSWMTEQVEAIGWMPFPEAMAWIACFTEFAGGLLIAIGLFTRPAAFFLAITMAVAAFSAQDVALFTGIHVTQGYLWSYVAVLGLGAGRLSLDHLLGERAMVVGVVCTLILAGYSLSQGIAEPEPELTEEFKIEAITIPGSFNNWDPTSHEMAMVGDSVYQLDFTLPSGLIEFKFAANMTWDVNMGVIDQTPQGF